MSKDLIRYDLLVQQALKGVVRKVLVDVARDGLPPEHHFYISFRTDAAGARVSSRLREKYPEEMTIVLQHQFWDLNINEHTFEVGLSFSGVPERLLVPFDAITGFFDPSVQFGLKFDLKDDTAEDADEPATEIHTDTKPATPKAVPAKAVPAPAEIGKARKDKGDKAADTDQQATASTKGESKSNADDDAAASPAEEGGAEVVSLDAFRKKH